MRPSIQEQPEQRQILYADAALALPKDAICVTPYILDAKERQSRDAQDWFGVANLGTLMLRAADGTEMLGDVTSYGGLNLGTLYAIRQAMETRQWPGAELSTYDRQRLHELGIKHQEFPLIAFQMGGCNALYREGRGQSRPIDDQLGDGIRYATSKYRLPFISDMDVYSRRYLEDLWNMSLHRTESRTLPPDVMHTGTRTHINTSEGAQLRTRMLTKPFPLDGPTTRALLARCRE